MARSGGLRISIKYKVGLIFLLMLLVFSAAIIFSVSRIITTGIEESFLERVRTDLALGKEIINLQYPGEWSIKDGKMYKGDVLINGNFEIVDKIGNLAGTTATIFQGDTRVTTNVKKADGTRAVDTKVSDIVRDSVLIRSVPYYGEAIVVDRMYETAYEPLKNAQGQVIGIWYVGIPKEVSGEMIREMYLTVALISGILLLLLLLVWSVLFKRIFIKPFQNIQAIMAKAEKGDLTARGQFGSGDEMGQLINSFNHFLDKIRQMMLDVRGNAFAVHKAIEHLFNIIRQIAANSVEMDAKVSVVNSAIGQIAENITGTAATSSATSNYINMNAAAVEEMYSGVQKLASASEEISASVEQVSERVGQNSNGINNISRSAQDMSASVNSVAMAVKEINISLNEVSRNCERSIQITDNASNRAADTRSIIGKLNDSSKQIGKIVNVINDIAEQTKMLALNAAIEAAGAGEAGRGFTVVANEVKELAKQTAEATDEISLQIETMQGSMAGAVDAVKTITQVIDEISDITNTIAAAVTEQSAATGEISKSVVSSAEKVNLITREISEVAENASHSARNIDEASQALQDIAHSISELSLSANEASENTVLASEKVAQVAKEGEEISQGAVKIAKNVQQISQSSRETANGSAEMNKWAEDLAGMVQKMENAINQFNI